MASAPRVVPPRIVPAPARDAAHVVPTPVVLAFRAPRQVYNIYMTPTLLMELLGSGM